eukprot:scaffold9251_cov92-Cyclotella_meneghiniana.AAC.6
MRVCVVLGVSPIPPGNDGEKIKDSLIQTVKDINGVTFVSSSIVEEDNEPTQLLSCVTEEASVDEMISVLSNLLKTHRHECTCELWGSAPGILHLKPIEGYEFHLFYDNASVFEEWASITMKQWGIFVQKDLLSSEEVGQLRKAAVDEIEQTESLLKLYHPHLKIGQDMISFKEIASRGHQRFDLLVTQSSRVVLDLIIPRVAQVLKNILGELDVEVDCDMSVVYSKPGAPNQGWHADGDHQKGANDAGLEVNGWKSTLSDPYALCLFIPLIDLDDTTGYTQFWPASHRNKGLAGFGAFAEIAESTWDGKCTAGTAIWYDYRLMHHGIKNDSILLRPVLQLLFKRKWYVETRNYGTESLAPL